MSLQLELATAQQELKSQASVHCVALETANQRAEAATALARQQVSQLAAEVRAAREAYAAASDRVQADSATVRALLAQTMASFQDRRQREHPDDPSPSPHLAARIRFADLSEAVSSAGGSTGVPLPLTPTEVLGFSTPSSTLEPTPASMGVLLAAPTPLSPTRDNTTSGASVLSKKKAAKSAKKAALLAQLNSIVVTQQLM
jgi:hypothetical protein